MTEFTYPYSTAFFMDTLGIEAVEWDIVRFDEFDSQGTGLDMQSEMADPKWSATLIMRELYNAEARAMNAKVRKLDGSAFSFMVYDPSNPYPAADPKGIRLSGYDWVLATGAWRDDGVWRNDAPWSGSFAPNVQVNSIGSNNSSISLKGLPASYTLTIGDKGQISFGTDQVFFFEISETIIANGSGVTAEFEIWPHVSIGVVVNQSVNLAKPACKMTLKPGAHSPGRSQGVLTSGASLAALEHI